MTARATQRSVEVSRNLRRRGLDEGCGVGACTFLAVDGNVEFDAIATVGGDPGFHEAVSAACRETNTDITFRMYLSAPCTSLATSGDAQRVESDPGSQKLLDLGIRDVLAVLGTNPGGYGVALMAYRRDDKLPALATFLALLRACMGQEE